MVFEFHNLLETSRNHTENHIGALAIEVARLLSRLVHQWESLTDNKVFQLRDAITNSVGIKNLISDDNNYITKLLVSEMLKDLEIIVNSVARFANKCSNSLVNDFENTFVDKSNIDTKNYKLLVTWRMIEGYVTINQKKYLKMETLGDIKEILIKGIKGNEDQDKKKVVWKGLKKISLWNRSRDYIFLLLARSTFDTFKRFGYVFIGGDINSNSHLSRFCSKHRIYDDAPPKGTLGDAGLALLYANVIVAIEKLAASPLLIGRDERDDLYNMLPTSVTTTLRSKLKLRPFDKSSGSFHRLRSLSEEISRTLKWLCPLAYDMKKWQHEKSFGHQSMVCRTNVSLVQTLYYASQEKTEAIIIQLLVSLNHSWRLGRKLEGKALWM